MDCDFTEYVAAQLGRRDDFNLIVADPRYPLAEAIRHVIAVQTGHVLGRIIQAENYARTQRAATQREMVAGRG